MKSLFIAIVVLSFGAISARMAGADDHIVYSVQRSLNMGNPGEVTTKDFYINMGKVNGVVEGAVLDVYRRASTYDLLSEKLYRDVTFPFAKLKVIHVEKDVAIARFEKILPEAAAPVVTPRAVMVGDIVKLEN